jgi:hypothetical protein
MGEAIRLVSKSERERVRLIREARAIYDSVFPCSVSEQRDRRPHLKGPLMPMLKRALSRD